MGLQVSKDCSRILLKVVTKFQALVEIFRNIGLII